VTLDPPSGEDFGRYGTDEDPGTRTSMTIVKIGGRQFLVRELESKAGSDGAQIITEVGVSWIKGTDMDVAIVFVKTTGRLKLILRGGGEVKFRPLGHDAARLAESFEVEPGEHVIEVVVKRPKQK
jgi:hypothetical protein